MTTGVVRVLVVDDSAYVRKVLRQMLSRSPFLEVVGAARDGEEALELVEQLQPDVVTLDLVMPRLDGLGFVKAQMARSPLPIVVVSIAGERSEMALRALEAGAVEIVQKPTALANEKILEIADELIEVVKSAAGAHVRAPAVLATGTTTGLGAGPSTKKRGTGAFDILVMGVSTGGPQALRTLIPQLPAEFPIPIALVLHMPEGYTALYAESLNAVSQLEVVEARDGMPCRAGTVLVAPGGQHLKFRKNGAGEVLACLDRHPADSLHRPSVDVLFQSAAEVYGGRVLGVVLTGMGSDGLQGAAWVKAQGGRVFTESEESCVIYGMPRSIVEVGLSDRSVPLSMMADVICESI